MRKEAAKGSHDSLLPPSRLHTASHTPHTSLLSPVLTALCPTVEFATLTLEDGEPKYTVLKPEQVTGLLKEVRTHQQGKARGRA